MILRRASINTGISGSGYIDAMLSCNALALSDLAQLAELNQSIDYAAQRPYI